MRLAANWEESRKMKGLKQTRQEKLAKLKANKQAKSGQDSGE